MVKTCKPDSQGDWEGDVRLSPDVGAVVSSISDLIHVCLRSTNSSPRTTDSDAICAPDC